MLPHSLLSLNPPEGKTILAIIGFAGQALFTARIVVQWWASEKAGKSVVPASFWWLSVWGTVLLAVYAWSTKDVIFILGPTVNLFLYVRNLMLMRPEAKPRRSTLLLLPLAAVILFSGAVAVYFAAQEKHILEWVPSPFWAIVGLIGMALWTLRFPVQWIVSERLGRSTLPPSFWWMSILGAAFLTAYAAFKVDWVFMLAYALNPIPAVRNLMLIYRKPKPAAESADSEEADIETPTLVENESSAGSLPAEQAHKVSPQR